MWDACARPETLARDLSRQARKQPTAGPSTTGSRPPRLLAWSGQTWESLLYYKTLDKVRGMPEIVKRFQGLVNINHVIGTRYRNGDDMIGKRARDTRCVALFCLRLTR